MNYPKTSFFSTLNTPVKNYSEREVRFVLEVVVELKGRRLTDVKAANTKVSISPVKSFQFLTYQI